MLRRIISWFREDFFKRLVKNSLTLITGNIGASILGSISMVISLKVLGIEVFGLYTLIQTYVRIFDGLLNFQNWEAIIKFGSQALAQNDIKALKAYIKQGFILDIASAVLGTIVAYILVGIVGKFYDWSSEVLFLTRLFCLTIFFNIAGTPIGILRVFRNFKVFSAQKIISAIIKLIGVVIAYFLGGDLFFFIVVTIVTQVVGYWILIVMSVKSLNKNNVGDFYKEPIKNSGKFYKFAVWSNLNTTLSLPMREMDKVITSLISYEAVGIYKFFKQIISIIGKVVTPVFQSLYPELATLISEGKFKKAVSVSKRMGLIILSAGLPFLVILAPTSPIWLKWVVDSYTTEHYYILAIFLFFRIVSNAFIAVNPLFISTGYVRYNLFITLFASIIYLSSAFYLSSLIGLLGVVLASFIETTWTYGIKIFIMSRDPRISNRRVK